MRIDDPARINAQQLEKQDREQNGMEWRSVVGAVKAVTRL
jgi:hypothetical protein